MMEEYSSQKHKILQKSSSKNRLQTGGEKHILMGKTFSFQNKPLKKIKIQVYNFSFTYCLELKVFFKN